MTELENRLLEFWMADAAVWRKRMRVLDAHLALESEMKPPKPPREIIVPRDEPSAAIMKAAARISASTIKDFATQLLKAVHRQEDDHDIGFDYGDIHAMVLRRFPTVRVRGPHFGKPTKFPKQELHELTCALNAKRIRLPHRPRKRRVMTVAPRRQPLTAEHKEKIRAVLLARIQ